MTRYMLYKGLGVCPNCLRKPEKGNVYCAQCAQKRRESAKQAYYRNKERQKTDPEFREHQKELSAERRIRYRAKCKAEKRCYACGKPATHGVFCTKHWIQNVEKGSEHPFRRMTEQRPKLPIPQVSDRTRIDVGKLITLYNAGWSYKHIEIEMDIGHSTIARYVRLAKEALNVRGDNP